MSARTKARGAAVVCTLGLSGAALGQPGSLDPTFGDDGRVLTNFTADVDEAAAVVVQPGNGKIVVAGTVGDWGSPGQKFGLARYRPNGTLDRTFGGDGRVVTDFAGANDYALDVALQSADGKIVVVGGTYGGLATVHGMVGIARYNRDGTLDRNFGGGDGKVKTVVSAGNDYATGVAIQADGKIVVSVDTGYVGGSFAVVRYNPDGTLDASFGEGGKVVTDLTAGPDLAEADALQGDGKIVVAGGSYGDTFALARYTVDGTLDETFGDDGQVQTEVTFGNDFARAVAIQPVDGRIVAAGRAGPGFGTVRYNPDGTLDTSFSGDGKMRTRFSVGGDIASDLVAQADGKTLVVGTALPQAINSRLALVRYNADGTLDTSFGGDGKIETDLTRRHDTASGVALQPADGRIVVAGGVAHRRRPGGKFAVVRYQSD